jgi:hypothetical protein
MDRNLFIGNYQIGVLSRAGQGTLQEVNTGLPLDIAECGCSAPYPTVLSFTALDSTVFVALKKRGIYSSPNNGATWFVANSGLSDTNVNTLFATNGILLAGMQDKGIFRSKDRGASWSSCGTNLSGIPVSAFASNGTMFFAGTGNGVFYSIDSGVTWNKGETEFNDSVKSLLVDGNYLLAGTATRGVWRRPISEFQSGVGIRQSENVVKSTLVSMQKRGSYFSCRFNLARTERVTIKLYNLQGKIVELLENSRVSPGEHVFESDLRKYKSGYYVIRFEGGSVCRSTPFTIY